MKLFIIFLALLNFQATLQLDLSIDITIGSDQSPIPQRPHRLAKSISTPTNCAFGELYPKGVKVQRTFMTPNAKDCRDWCKKHNECRAFTYKTGYVSRFDNGCTLYTNETSTEAISVYGGPKSCPASDLNCFEVNRRHIEYVKNRRLNHYKGIKDARKCQSICNNVSECGYFSFFKLAGNFSGDCYTFSKSSIFQVNVLTLSGPEDCIITKAGLIDAVTVEKDAAPKKDLKGFVMDLATFGGTQFTLLEHGSSSYPELQSVGNWTKSRFCDEKMFVFSFRDQHEAISQNCRNDTSAINGLGIQCVRKDSWRHQWLTSTGPFGDMELNNSNDVCGDPFDHLFGLAVKFGYQQCPTSQRRRDALGLVDIKLTCPNGQEIKEGSGINIGTWSQYQYCPLNHRICGFQSKIQDAAEAIAAGEKYGMTNIRFFCCYYN